jgi:uncharacterized protein (DUF488 family)
MHQLYTLGYNGQLLYQLQALAEHLDAVVVDFRFSPRSRVPKSTARRLQRVLGEQYRHLPH